MSIVRVLPSARRAVLAGVVLSFAAYVLPSSGMAQSAQPLAALRPVAQVNRVSAGADFSARTTLAHHLPAWVHVATQTAQPVDLSETMHVTVVLRRDDVVEAAFEKLLADQQDPSSPMYHQWITPEQVGTLFGPTQADVLAVTSWLQSEGLSVDAVQPNRVLIEASGPAAKVASAFRTQFAFFSLNGKQRFSAATAPSIPTALMSVISGINGLTEIHHAPNSHAHLGMAPVTMQNGKLRPELNATSGGVTEHFLAPGDFNIIYDVSSVLNSGNKGATIGSAAQHVAIIARSRVDPTDVTNFENATGIGSIQPNYVIAGTDPGLTKTGDQDEVTLDFDRVASTAPGAIPDIVMSASSRLQDGVYIAATYNVNTQKDPVMSLSFGSCEADDSGIDSSTYRTLFQTGAAEGMSIFVSSGDSGADGCYSAGTPAVTGTPSANDLCNDYTTCVGGTEFAEGSGTYWASSNSTGFVSALSYIPEGAWNEPIDSDTGQYVMASSGGGPSIFIARPSWQTATGVPAGTFRETPDVSFTSAGHDGYFACLNFVGGTCVQTSQGLPFVYFSGTSAAAPSMAAVAALLNTKLGKAQGLLNPLLYRLAGTAVSSFHDVTTTTSGVGTCSTGTTSLCNNSTPTCSNPNATTPCTTGSLTAAVAGYPVGLGYDDVTGLGSLDVANFLNAAAQVSIQTTLAVTAAPNPAPTNTAVTLTATLTPASSGTNAASGTVTFYANGTQIGTGSISSNVATLNHTFSTAGTYSITATYGGDSTYGSSTSTAVSLVVSSAFTVSAATTTYGVTSAVVSGASLTDNLTVTSVAPFAGSVALSCAVTAASGSQADTQAASGAHCSLLPSSVTVASAGAGPSVLTITTTPGTSGAFNVTVTGTSGSNTATSQTIAVTLTAASFTVTNPTPATLSLLGGASSGNTSQLTVTSVNGFTGTVNFSCAATASGVGSASANFAGTCTASPVTLTANGTGTTTVSVTTTAGSYGVLNLVVSGTGTTAGASIATGSACGTSTQACIAVTVVQPFAVSISAPTAATSGVTSSTATVTFQTQVGFTGVITPQCGLGSAGAIGTTSTLGTCTFSPATVTMGAGGTASTTLTVTPSATATSPLAVYVVGTAGSFTTSAATANVTINPPYTVAAGGTLTLTSGATTGNTENVTVTAATGFAGTVNLSCSISTSTAAYQPSCAVSPLSVNLTSGSSASATVTVSSHVAVTQGSVSGVQIAGLWLGGGLASLLGAFALRRRKALRLLAMAVLFTCGLGALSGCGGGAGSVGKTTQSSAGNYTVTVQGTSGSISVPPATFNLVIQ